MEIKPEDLKLSKAELEEYAAQIYNDRGISSSLYNREKLLEELSASIEEYNKNSDGIIVGVY